MNELDNNEIIWQKQVHITIIDIRVMTRVMVFYATFNNTSLYRGGQFYRWRKSEFSEKPTDLPLPLINFIT
jgi:hypothetical protein